MLFSRGVFKGEETHSNCGPPLMERGNNACRETKEDFKKKNRKQQEENHLLFSPGWSWCGHGGRNNTGNGKKKGEGVGEEERTRITGTQR